MLDIISSLWNLLRLVLWHSIWSTLENVPCILEKESILLFGDVRSFRYLLNPTSLLYHFRLWWPHWLPLWMICPFMSLCVEVFNNPRGLSPLCQTLGLEHPICGSHHLFPKALLCPCHLPSCSNQKMRSNTRLLSKCQNACEKASSGAK